MKVLKYNYLDYFLLKIEICLVNCKSLGSLLYFWQMTLNKKTLQFIGSALSCTQLLAVEVDINGSIAQTFVKTSANQEDWSSLSNTKNGSFEFSEVLIGTSAQLNEKCRAGAQLISRDFGSLGNFETQLDWGYGDYRFDEKLGIRAGKMKLPRGLYNETRDIDGARTNILLDQGMYPEDWRGFVNSFQGLGLYGSYDRGDGRFGSLDYQIYGGTINIPSDFFVVNNLKNNIDDHIDGIKTQRLGGLQLGYYPAILKGFKLNGTFLSWKGNVDMYLYNQGGLNAVSAFNTAYGTSLNNGVIDSALQLDYDSYELGFEYLYKAFTFFGEIQKVYVRSTYASDVEVAQRAVAATPGVNAGLAQALGALQGAMTPYSADKFAWNSGVNYQWNEKIQTRISYSKEQVDKDISEFINRTTLSLRYDFNYHMIGKLEYTDYYSDQKATLEKHYGLFMARLGFSF